MDGCGPLCFVADILLVKGKPKLFGRCGTEVKLDIGDDHSSTLLRQAPGDRLAEPGCAARYQGHFVIQSPHQSAPCGRMCSGCSIRLRNADRKTALTAPSMTR